MHYDLAARSSLHGSGGNAGEGSAAPGPKSPRWSAERRARPAGRAPRLDRRGPSRVTSATTEDLRLSALRSPLMGADGTEKEQTRAQQRAAGTKKTALFDMVNRKLRSRCRPRHPTASAATRSCPGRARASARLVGRGAGTRARAGTQGPYKGCCCCASRFLRWVHASRVYPTCAHLSADLGQARDRCLAEFTLGPREARTRGLARDKRAAASAATPHGYRPRGSPRPSARALP